MFVAAALCPHPPLLVPELAGGAVEELAALRGAADTAVAAMVAARPDLVVVLGSGEPAGELSATAWGTLAPYGVAVQVVPPGADPTRPAELPLPLTVGAWLLGRAAWAGPTAWVTTGATPSSEDVRRLAAELSCRAPRVGVLAMGAGSARRLASGPGGEDPQARPYDDALARVLGGADAEALLALDPAEAARLIVTGLGPWQVLAAGMVGTDRIDARLLHASTPYGVTYLVASWLHA